MDFYKTTAAFGATACLLMASTAFGDAIRSETFEGANDVGAWTGSVAQEAGSPAGVAPAGLPISSTAGAKVLSVTGSATNGNFSATASKDTLVDMMVKVSIPDSALTALDLSGDAAGARFAVAVDTTTVGNETKGVFKYFSGVTQENASGWTEVSSATFSDNDWVRLTMKFYYSKATPTCVVALNGNTCGEFPFITATTTLASIEVKGSTALDEVLVTQDSMVAKFDSDSAKPEGAEYATKKWLTANNVTWPTDSSAATTLDAQYKFGLDPKGTDTTLPLSFAQDTSTTDATLSFPGFGAYGGTGAYFLDTSSDNSTWTLGETALTVSGTGVNTTTVALPSTAGQAVYYRVRAAASN